MRTNTQENEMTSVNAKHEALLDELLKDYTSPLGIGRCLTTLSVAIGRALQPFPRSKRSRHVSAHSAFQLGLSTLEGRIRRCRRRGAPASKGRHLPSSLCPLTSFLTGLP